MMQSGHELQPTAAAACVLAAWIGIYIESPLDSAPGRTGPKHDSNPPLSGVCVGGGGEVGGESPAA